MATTKRRFLIAPRIRTEGADRAIIEKLRRLEVDSVIELGGPARAHAATMRTAVISNGQLPPSSAG